MRNAGASLVKVWSALDVDEIKDVSRGFLFQLMAVLCTGHNETLVGKLISKWCLLLNLGTLFIDNQCQAAVSNIQDTHPSQESLFVG